MGPLKKHFNKAVATGLLAFSLMGATQANAQQAGPPPQPTNITYTQGNTQTAPVTMVKPWSNDPIYMETIRNEKIQSDARLRAWKAEEDQWQSNLRNDYDKGEAWIRQRSLDLARSQASWKDKANEASRIGIDERQIAATFKAQKDKAWADYDVGVNKETSHFDWFVQQLDDQYLQRPEYKAYRDRLANINNPPPVQAAPVKDVTGGGIALSPEQQHARIVRLYQDKQFEALQKGTTPPKPEDFGLSKTDPALRNPGGP